MSELGILSQHYEVSAARCRQINEALIAVKKKFYELPGQEAVSEEFLAESLHVLASVVEGVRRSLSHEPRDAATPTLELPPSVAERLREEQRASLAHYLDDLASMSVHLADPRAQLTEADLKHLDAIGQAVSADLGAVYRRMRRR